MSAPYSHSPAAAAALLAAARDLTARLAPLRFSEPVSHVYNPLEYAWAPFETYVSRFGHGPKRAVFLGMNPGPFGMAQTGVPFGEIPAVRDWMGVHAPVERPPGEHPKRPVEGFACQRSEVSGRRLWGWAAHRWGTPDAFFREHFVVNYCPLVFMEATGRNRTPDKVPASEMAPVYDACDAHLRKVLEILQPEWAIGIGGFAQDRLRHAVETGHFPSPPRVDTILHPSPASPAANRGWSQAVEKKLAALGFFPPPPRLIP